MVNTQTIQTEENSLPRRDQRRSIPPSLRDVWQDKSASKRDRVASRQPETERNAMRTHHMNTEPARTQNKPKAKRQTVPVMFWVKPRVKAELQRIAESEGLSLSATGGTFLEEAIRQKLHTQHAVLLQPIIETAIRNHMRGISNRLAALLVRVAFDAGQTRTLVYNLLTRHPSLTQKEVDTIMDGSKKIAKRNLAQRTPPELKELIAEVHAYLASEEENAA